MAREVDRVARLAATSGRRVRRLPGQLPPSSMEPGEFTKLFQSPVAPPVGEPGSPAIPAVSAPPVRVSFPRSRQKPGEFTRIFQSPVAPPVAGAGLAVYSRSRAQVPRLGPQVQVVYAFIPGTASPARAAPAAPVKAAGPANSRGCSIRRCPTCQRPATGRHRLPSHGPERVYADVSVAGAAGSRRIPRPEASSRSSFDRGPGARSRAQFPQHPSFRKQRRRLPRLRGKPSPAIILACSVREG